MALYPSQTYPSSAPAETGDWASCMRVGADHMRVGAYADAVGAFAQAAALRPSDPTAALNHAAALLRAGSAEQALAIYDRLLADHPSQPKLHHAHALALNAAGDRIAATLAFYAAVAIDPDAWRSWQSIADITPDEAERRHAIARAAEALTRLCAEARAPATLFPTCVSGLIDAGRAADAIPFLDANAERFADIVTVHDARARGW